MIIEDLKCIIQVLDRKKKIKLNFEADRSFFQAFCQSAIQRNNSNQRDGPEFGSGKNPEEGEPFRKMLSLLRPFDELTMEEEMDDLLGELKNARDNKAQILNPKPNPKP